MQRGGCDDYGHIVNKEVGYALGHRRLSIIDLSETGHQPMEDKSDNLEIIFNGEIYNYKELKTELITLGHTFVTESDTEVILKGYSQWHTNVLDKIKGMFAFVLIDKKVNKLFAARDHAGIKPLYIGKKNGDLYFSSEIRGIKALNNNWEENNDWKIWFLTFGFLPEPITTLKDVAPLARGHYLEIDLTTKKEVLTQYYKYNYANSREEYSQAVSKTKKLLEESVKRHLVSDVPVGIFLSGGIDSSILALIAQQQSTAQIETISVYFDDEKYSEKEFQDIIVKKTGVKHHSIKITKQDFLDSWDDIFESLDQPTTDSINSYFICKFAKKLGFKVVLSGLGADEIFGGYPSVKRSLNISNYTRLALLKKLLPDGIIKNYPAKKLDFLNEKISASEYLVYRGLFTPKDVATILNIPKKQVLSAISTFSFSNKIIDFEPQNRATYFETAIYMQNQLLKDSDMQSMWHSLELRVPFLDKDLMDYVNNLSVETKFGKLNIKPKSLLVDAFIDELPTEIWQRPKMGFTFPFEKWFQEIPVFANSKVVPDWVYKLFTKNKLNFSRLWAVLISHKKEENKIELNAVKSTKTIEVVHFQRKRRKTGNHSIESYFASIRELQPNDISITAKIFSNLSSGIINRVFICFEAYFNRSQINHITGDIHFANFFLTKKNTILTIHDCGILKRKKGILHNLIKFFWFTIPAKKSAVITVNSEATKNDLLSYIKFPKEKIIPIYIFVPEVHCYSYKDFNKTKPVILQIGTAPNKNIPRIAKALNGITCEYIIIGNLDSKTVQVLIDNKIEYKNVNTSISNTEMAEYYRKCDIVSFASTFEGFGMPIAEANLTGRVVVTSNNSSMPEVGADAAIYVDPYDINSIRSGFLTAINNDDFRNELIKNGIENAKRFDKKVLAEKYFNLYRTIANCDK